LKRNKAYFYLPFIEVHNFRTCPKFCFCNRHKWRDIWFFTLWVLDSMNSFYFQKMPSISSLMSLPLLPVILNKWLNPQMEMTQKATVMGTWEHRETDADFLTLVLKSSGLDFQKISLLTLKTWKIKKSKISLPCVHRLNTIYWI
jgi:hypothetical protein